MPAYVALCTDAKGDLYATDFAGTLYHNARRSDNTLTSPGLGTPVGTGWRSVRQLAVLTTAPNGRRIVIALDWSGRLLAAAAPAGTGAWAATTFTARATGTWADVTTLAGGADGHGFGVGTDGRLRRRTFTIDAQGGVTRRAVDVLTDTIFDMAAKVGAQLRPEAQQALAVVGNRLVQVGKDGATDLRAIDRTVWRIGASLGHTVMQGLTGHRRILGAGNDGFYVVSGEGQLLRQVLTAAETGTLRTTIERTVDTAVDTAVTAMRTKALDVARDTIHDIVGDTALGTVFGKAFGASAPTTPTYWQPVASGLMSWAALSCNVEAYVWPQSALPGESVNVYAALTLLRADALANNANARTFDAALVRLRRMKNGVEGDYDEVLWTSTTPYQASVPPALTDTFMQTGCNWPETFSVTIPADAPSGHYAVRLVPRDGSGRFYAPIIVRPTQRTAPFVMLANTNTWNCYNQWGGRGKYVHDAPLPYTLPFMRPHPGLTPDILGPLPTTELMNESHHLLRGELWVAGWLQDLGADYAFDVYTDRDFHRGLVDLRPTGAGGYRGMILNTHPEYWSVGMHDQLVSYLQPTNGAGGGSVIYLGGNGLYEEVTLSDDDQHLGIFPGVDLTDDLYATTNEQARQFCLMRVRGRPEAALLGVGFNNAAGCSVQGQPYVVDPTVSNPVLTGLTPAAAGQPITLGAKSANTGFSADGWEVDVRGTGTPAAALAANARVAIGATAATSGEMLCFTTPAGGTVFAGSSLNVGGALAVDPNLQRVVRNALDMARGMPPVIA